MNLLYIGHYALDVYHLPEGGVREQQGGLVRAVTAIASLLEKKDRIVPVCGVHQGDEAGLRGALSPFPGVDLSGLFVQATPTNRVHFYPRASGQHVACTDLLSPPIPFGRIRPFLDVDGVLINMLSGSDITLETLDEIRMAVRGKGVILHLDYHNLVRGIEPNKERTLRPLPEWRRWAFMVDTIQANEEEIARLTVEQMSEVQAAGHLLALGVKGVLITCGARGVRFYTSEHKHIMETDIPGVEGSDGEDAPGAGDLFGGIFFSRWLKTGDMPAAARFAAGAASAAVLGQGRRA